MVLTVLLVQKVHKVHVVKTVPKDDQVSQDFQEHKVPKEDEVLQENVVQEVQRVTPDLKVKRENHQLNSDHPVSTESQDQLVYKEKEAETVLMVFKGQEDHKDQEENLAWLDHQANTITINCELSSQKS